MEEQENPNKIYSSHINVSTSLNLDKDIKDIAVEDFVKVVDEKEEVSRAISRTRYRKLLEPIINRSPPEGWVRVIELPSNSYVVHTTLSGTSSITSKGRSHIDFFSQRRLTNVLYGKEYVTYGRHLSRYHTLKRCVLVSIPMPNYHHGGILLQYIPIVYLDQHPKATIATRFTLISFDILPPHSKVSEAIAAALTHLANKYGTQVIGEIVQVSALRPSLGEENATALMYQTYSGKKYYVRLWYVKNLPPLPKVEYLKAPPITAGGESNERK